MLHYYHLENKFRHFRKLNNMLQRDLADTIGVERSYITEIEGNRKMPSVDNIKKIIEILGAENNIIIPEYKLFLMDNPSEKINKYIKENNISLNRLSKILDTNVSYIKRCLYGTTIISKSIYEKLKQIGIR